MVNLNGEAGVLQVLLRLQWQRQEVRGRLVQVDVALAGLELSVMGGLQDELINLTLDRLEWHLERRRVEARVQGHIRRVQLDNQMLDATHPVRARLPLTQLTTFQFLFFLFLSNVGGGGGIAEV